MKSRMKIQEGIDIVADAVGVTLGPRGASAYPPLSIAPPASGCPRAVPRAPGPDPIAPLSSGRNVVLAEKIGMPQVPAPRSPTDPPRTSRCTGFRVIVRRAEPKFLPRSPLTSAAHPPRRSIVIHPGDQRRRHHRARHRAPRPRAERRRPAHQGGGGPHQRLCGRRHHHRLGALPRDDPPRSPVRDRRREPHLHQQAASTRPASTSPRSSRSWPSPSPAAPISRLSRPSPPATTTRLAR